MLCKETDMSWLDFKEEGNAACFGYVRGFKLKGSNW
jgi:hypothetical protein